MRHGGGDDQLYLGVSTTGRIDARVRIETESGYNDYRLGLSHAAEDSLVVVGEAFRYSAHDRQTESEWTLLDSPSKESKLVNTRWEGRQAKTAKTLIKLLCNCATYQFHDTSNKSSFNVKWDVTENGYLRSDGGTSPRFHCGYVKSFRNVMHLYAVGFGAFFPRSVRLSGRSSSARCYCDGWAA